MTQKEMIKEHLAAQGGWVRGYELRGKETQFGFLGSQGDRRARELAQAGEISHRIEDGFAEYRAKTLINLPISGDNYRPERTREMVELRQKLI